LAIAAFAPLAGQGMLQSNPPSSPDVTHAPPANAPVVPDAHSNPKEAQAAQQSAPASNAEAKKRIADESARLLKLATDLNVEVGKTTQDTLSLAVIRKAAQLERLAHEVKEKSQPSVAAN
jgi:small-conductance mechanosensitive channel